MKNRRRVVLIALLVLVGCIIAAWLTIRPRDPLFRGKPESWWIEHLVYNDVEQVKQWREFGPVGVRVLGRALDGANRPSDRIYRQVYRGTSRILPGPLIRLMPAPRMDATRVARMTVVDILSRLSKDAKLAIPAMTLALNDEDSSVRQIAINFFTQGEDENCLLNQMDPKAKKELLPEFIRAVQDNDWGLRNNALVALRFYPEQAQIVDPVLIAALQDPVPTVRRLAADALKRVDPAAAAKAGVK